MKKNILLKKINLVIAVIVLTVFLCSSAIYADGENDSLLDKINNGLNDALEWGENAADDVGSFFVNLFGGGKESAEPNESTESMTVPVEEETTIKDVPIKTETEVATQAPQEETTSSVEYNQEDTAQTLEETTAEQETETTVPIIDRVLEQIGDSSYADTYQALAAGETIEKGDVGEHALSLQKLLVSLGEAIEQDGSAGTYTFNALNRVQNHCGQEMTSSVDADSFEQLLYCLLAYSDRSVAEEILGQTADEYQMQVYDHYDGINELSPGSYFNAYYLDVGQADAIVIVCDNEAMMIDGGGSASSDYIYSFLKQNNIDHLKYIICTHPQEDHAGGLAGALNYATVEKAYCSTTDYDGEEFHNFTKYLEQQGVQLEVPDPGTEFRLGSAAGRIIGPVNKNEDQNNSSLVVKIKYGETSYLFTGDEEEQEEMDLVKSGEDLSCTVLKVAHHGSDTSSTEAFLRAAAPTYAVISCGAFNSYGHPSDGTLDRLRENGIQLYRTDQQGTIVLSSSGYDVEFTPERDAGADTYATYYSLYVEPETTTEPEVIYSEPDTNYIANTNSGRFHYTSCRSVRDMKEENKWYFSGTAEELVDLGYIPCAICQPYASNYVPATTAPTTTVPETSAAVVAEEPAYFASNYIVNTNTGKFHNPSCGSVSKMKESNKWYYQGTRDELISMGYSPCGNCHP